MSGLADRGIGGQEGAEQDGMLAERAATCTLRSIAMISQRAIVSTGAK
nr:hypothetical protein [Azospirillum sp. 412522]